jgi:hypothetical protein
MSNLSDITSQFYNVAIFIIVHVQDGIHETNYLLGCNAVEFEESQSPPSSGRCL